MSERRGIFLIRHGRSDFDSNDTRESPRGLQWDPPLSAEGRRQAGFLTKRLMLMPNVGAVYSSPFRRALQTIAPYAEATGTDVQLDEDLGEAFAGEWENRPFEEILASDEQILHKYRNQDAIWRHAPGAERLEHLRERVGQAVETLIKRHPEGNLVVVAHGGVINAYIAPLLQIDHEMFFLPENTSLNSVDIDGDERRVRFLNDVRHLTEPELFEP